MTDTMIVTDTGFHKPTDTGFTDVDGALPLADVPSGTQTAAAIRISFASYADGRGFSLAAQLRRAGYTGHLRAYGPLVADQYAMARRAGFDDVEIPADIAARQPEDQWLARADWRANSYQQRLGATQLSPSFISV